MTPPTMNMRHPHTFLAVLLAAASAGPALAQEAAPALQDFDTAAATVRQQLEDSVQELSALREQVAAERIPMGERLSALQAELAAVRAEYKETTRLLDSRTLDLSNLRTRIGQREDEVTYLSGLLGEYIRNFESRLHIAELQRYGEQIEAAVLAPENAGLSQEQVFQAQAGLLDLSFDRLAEALSGARFEGTAVDDGGRVQRGTFALVGPAGLFLPEGAAEAGTAEQRLGSLEPALLAFGTPEQGRAAARVVSTGSGLFPFDPTLGNAHKVEATRETFLEHVQKGGPIMYPIFALAGLALLVALYKWISMTLVPKPSRKRVEALLDSAAEQDVEAAEGEAVAIRGPTGRMLRAGVEHMRQPRELIEEVMYETVLTTRLKLQGLLPFIAICAASAPLLGLLGTVTGIINTFKLITVFGSGDVKSLSGGISEALITTKFGLIVAIPSLLLHAFLSRKARGIVDRMERTALSFLNAVSRRPIQPVHITPAEDRAAGGRAAPEPELVRAQVKNILSDLLVPITREGNGAPRSSDLN
jgi:biopolymer transport protein ExbB